MTSDRRPPEPFDLAIVTGFLGAGKTTLLNRMLRDPALANTLVLINEFGAIGLDHLLVERVEGDMLVMTSGCLCCSIRGDLTAALEDSLRKRDNGRIQPFERVLIETTGLADPAPVLHSLMVHPYLRLRFRVCAVVTLVDAVIGRATLARHKEAVKQVAMADRIVLTKTDLVEDNQARQALEASLHALNPAAPILDATLIGAEITALLTGSAYDPAARGVDVAAWLAAEAYASHEHDGPRDVDRHDAAIRAFCLRCFRPVSPMALALFMELLRSEHGDRLLRFKGLVALSDDPSRPGVAHGVQHVMHPIRRLEAWPDGDHTTRLVFILDKLDPAFVEALWRAAVGEPRIDGVDFQVPNPLVSERSGLLG